MNPTWTKTAPQTDLRALLQGLTELGPKLLLMSLNTTREFMEAAGELITGTLPLLKIEMGKVQKCCCEIPETECPPRCVCDIRWKACPGGTAQATIRVTNTGSVARTFTFVATPFSGPGNPKATVLLSPASATLNPGASAHISASFTVPPDFHNGRRYETEILIYGAYEQCVRITLDIEPPTAKDCCACECCEVRAGDPPVRIRAHHWYDHFQCTEPCLELECRDEGRRSDHV